MFNLKNVFITYPVRDNRLVEKTMGLENFFIYRAQIPNGIIKKKY
jgi:hypothetical protein